MLSQITEKLTKQIVLNFPQMTPEKAEQVEYGLYMALSDIIKILALVLISLPFGLFGKVIAAIITFGMLRVFLGGIHSKSEIECVVTYFAIIYGSIGLSVIINSFRYLNLIVFPIAFIFAFLYSPADMPCKPVASVKHRRKLRICGLTELAVLFLITFVVPNIYSNIISIITLIEALMLTPLVYRLTGNELSNALNKEVKV
jgi:accessory gene regulator B